MFTKNIKDSFTANLLSAVSGVLGEAKKCKDCGCAKCKCDEPEETKEGYVSHAQRKAVWANRADDGKGHPDKKKKMKKEGYMPTNDAPSDEDRKTAGKLSNLLKRERDAKEKKEPNGVKTEEADMPFEKPYRKAGERKDEYGNKVKNVAKHLAKKAMKANEEVEEIEEKRGLWDNIHAKRKRIEAGSGERMRKPGSEGAPSAADLKASQKEEVSIDEAFEQVDEISSDMAYRYLKGKRERDYDISADGTSSKLKKPQSFGKMNKDMKSTVRALRTIEKAKKTNEEVEELDEISKPTLGRYINKAKDSIDLTAWRQGYKEAGAGNPSRPLEKKLSKRHKGIETAVKKLTKEESEQIDELSKDTMGRYIKKAATKIGTQGVTAGLKIAKDERSKKNFDTIGKRERGISTAVKKLTKEEQDFIDALNDADMDQIDEANYDVDHMPGQTMSASAADKQTKKVHDDWAAGAAARAKGRAEAAKRKLAKEEVEELDELSKDAMLKYLSANKKSDAKAQEAGDYSKSVKRMRGTDLAVRKYTAKPGSKYVRVPATEEVELDEARGRPKKAGARDFTIHPKTKEKLMHNNPADMARIERLQKNGILQKPKTEANQHVIQQLQRAKLSMRGGETINFTHGDPTHVSGTHASKLLDKYAGMKPDEKEAFQKKIGHSHAKLKSEL